jgi:hypothetical protein
MAPAARFADGSKPEDLHRGGEKQKRRIVAAQADAKQARKIHHRDTEKQVKE